MQMRFPLLLRQNIEPLESVGAVQHLSFSITCLLASSLYFLGDAWTMKSFPRSLSIINLLSAAMREPISPIFRLHTGLPVRMSIHLSDVFLRISPLNP